MKCERHSRFTLWRNYFRNTLPALGPKPRRVSEESIRSAKRITILKRDNIGDMVLATVFLNTAYERWRDRDVLVVCTAAGEELVRAMYPRWTVQVLSGGDDPAQYKGRWGKVSDLRRRVEGWPQTDLMINLRSIRHQYEVLFDSWVPAKAKFAICNQWNYDDGDYLRVPDSRVYSAGVEGVTQGTADVCTQIANYRKLLGFFFPDVKAPGVWPELKLDAYWPAAKAAVAAKGGITADTLVWCPFPSGDIRRYPEDKFIDAVSRIARTYGLAVTIVGGPKDENAAQALANRLDVTKGVVALAGKLSVIESAAVISSAQLVVGVETGPLHMAVASRVPTIVLLGGGHYGIFGPWGSPQRVKWLTHPLPCFGCGWLCTQKEPFCITNIDAASIVDAADELLTGRAVV
ncbi:MAG: glycosyltransferase family 9 protein [Nibricoccus sp.]